LFGDGLQTRDFVYVGNVVQANLLAGTTPGIAGRAYNVGCGGRTSLLDLLGTLERILGRSIERKHDAPRAGDIRESVADISKIRAELGYDPAVSVEDGLRRLVEFTTVGR
jgi:UDP-glucose 4-epimerase